MTVRRSYGQYCAVARALDHVGDRWTLLVVRELLSGPRSVASLQSSLAGVSPSLLNERLRRMIDDGLIERSDGPRRSKHVTYALTPFGAELEPVLLALVRWGGRWMLDGPGDDCQSPGWAPLAVKAYVHGTVPIDTAPLGRVHLEIEGTAITIDVRRRGRDVVAGAVGDAQARLAGEMMTVLAVAAGLVPFSEAGFVVDGDSRLAAVALHD